MRWSGRSWLAGITVAVVASVTLMTIRAADAADRVALVIGNASYDDAPLRNPDNDADAMESALGRLGFDVVKLRDGNLREMQRAIGQFSRKLKGSRVALVYYSGHGIQVQGTNYLIPIDAKLESEGDVPLELVSLDAIMVQLAQAQTAVNIVILDACRTDPFLKAHGRSVLAGLAAVSAPPGTLIAYATAPGQVAEDGTGDDSPFTASLLQVIEQPGLKAEDVFKQARIRLGENTGNRQVSWETSSLVGDFYFAGGPATPAPVAAARPGPAGAVVATPQAPIAPSTAPQPVTPQPLTPQPITPQSITPQPTPAPVATDNSAKPQQKMMAGRGKLVFDVENATKRRINELYFVPIGTKNWEGNALDEDSVIDPKDSIEMNLNDGSNACVYDIMAVFDDGRKTELEGVNICDLQRVVVR